MKKIWILLGMSFLMFSCNQPKPADTEAPKTEEVQVENTAKQDTDQTSDGENKEEAKAPEAAPAEPEAKAQEAAPEVENAQKDEANQAEKGSAAANDANAENVIKVRPFGNKAFVSEGLVPATEHIKLKLKSQKSYGEWMDTEKWLEEHHFEAQKFPYSDDEYTYEGDVYHGKHQHDFQRLIVTSKKDGTKKIYDFSEMLTEMNRDLQQGFLIFESNVNYAAIYDGKLYVMIDGSYLEHIDSTFMMALDLEGNVLWRSEKRLANSRNFVIIKNTIITGFGSSYDPDFIYTLDINTGKVLDKISVKKAVDYFIKKDDLLYVSTYNREYVYTLK